ncbi:unnamed protein product [Cylindrotheca closterium]|uniref:UDENN domain-containing protein n=1 Tax=Cylindrotheca closterium TaxID=2856 RepID=A0AAD2FX09_9STRA|nr:unnamed protein product [Cylindrotheca closterium]
MSTNRRSIGDEDDHSTIRRRARHRGSGSGDSDDGDGEPMGSSSHSLSSQGRRQTRRPGEATSGDNLEPDGRPSSTAGIAANARSRDRTYNPTSRSERVSRVLDAATDDASAKSGRSRASVSTPNHEDELERIRGIRARRMRQERLDRGDDGSRSPSRNEARRMEHRMRRRELREAKANGETLSSPIQHRSTPAISRRELEDAGLVPRESARIGDTQSKPNRVRSHRLKDLSPSRHDDGASMSSARRRRDRSERMSSEASAESRWDRVEDIDARLRARRARRNASESVTVVSNLDADEGQPRERLSLSNSQDALSEASGYSGMSVGSGDSEFTGRRGERTQRQPTARRSPPPRSKSADEDLVQNGVDPSLFDRGARRRERQQLRMKTVDTRTTGLTERLRVRREARAAERANSASTTQGKTEEGEEMPSVVTQSVEQSVTAEETSSEQSSVKESPPESSNSETSYRALSPPATDQSGQDHATKYSAETLISRENLDELEPSTLSNDNDSDSKWSLKLKVITAEDLPPHITPSMPLCPFVKAGFVRVPDEPSDRIANVVMEKLGRNSIDKLKSSQVRYTTSKMLSKRDSGMVDFSQELRWDGISHLNQVALLLELAAHNVDTPQNIAESPPPLSQCDAFRVRVQNEMSQENNGLKSGRHMDANGDPVRSLSRNKSSESSARGFGAFWNRATNKKVAELQAAEAAAEMAKKIMEQDQKKAADNTKASVRGGEGKKEIPMKLTTTPQSDYLVALRICNADLHKEITPKEDVRIGSLVLPLSNLFLDRPDDKHETVKLDQWYKFEKATNPSSVSSSGWKNPSVRLELVFGSMEAMDKEENESKVEDIVDADPPMHPQKRLSMMNPSSARNKADEVVVEDPVLEPGVVDFVSVVGCRDIGSQKNDSGHKGWVDSTPESVILEQFPPNNEFHQKNGRNALLPEMIQWFCFPEGCKLWRGTGPPSHEDLKLSRFSASSPANIASSLSTFDACLGCTTSFSWFVIASNSDKYGSKLVKTYSAVIRFFAPAPLGIDPTQEDFAQNSSNVAKSTGAARRLWVPIGICLTSNLPIVGTMEAMLLRICEGLALDSGNDRYKNIKESLMSVILDFQKPMAGAVNSSIPFLAGHRFLLSMPTPMGLPALPHGRSVVSVCRLLGGEGLVFLLAAVLTECKILIHSRDTADIAMVAEVITALVYPFTWSLPYIPILPLGMLEFVEAPLSFILGIPTCNLQLIDPYALEDIVVIDLDNGISPLEFLESGRRSSKIERKTPTPLPANVATNISKAWHRLLRAEEEVEEQFGNAMLGEQSLPRLEGESLAEREFRISVAIEISSLFRGYDDCVGPVFNRDKFLKIAPALFEERRSRGVGNVLSSRSRHSSQKSISPRSKRFLSLLVNTQNFQQLLESLETDESWLFHEIMKSFEDMSSDGKGNSRSENSVVRSDKLLSQLGKKLQKIEDKVPTYLVDQTENVDRGALGDDDIFDQDDSEWFESFDNFGFDASAPNAEDSFRSIADGMLIEIDHPSAPEGSGDPNAISLEYLQKLEATPWKYKPIFEMSIGADGSYNESHPSKPRVKLRDAIGERRFRDWKIARDQKAGNDVDLAFLHDSIRAPKQSVAVDLRSLVSSATDDTATMISMSSSSSSLRSILPPEQQRVDDAKNRDLIRRCLDKANVSNGNWSEYNGGTDEDGFNPFLENGRDLMEEAEKALRNPTAQRFLLSILAQRSRLENQRARTLRHRQSSVASAASRVSEIAFECLVRLVCAMLDSCMEYNEFELAYRLLTHSAGFVMVTQSETSEDEDAENVVSMTSRIGLHPIFANIGVWRTVMSLHLRDRLSEIKSESVSSDDESEEEEEEGVLEYEAAVATLYEMVGYEIPGEELSRFAMHASEENGWFCDDRGRQLLMIARRIAIRRDQVEVGGAGDQDYMDLIRKSKDSEPDTVSLSIAEVETREWMEVGWCHPAAPSSVIRQDATAPKLSSGFMKRSPITAVASFGCSVIATGGLDGSVFMAHSIPDTSNIGESPPAVRGIHLDWGSASRAGTGMSSDGVYGVGAVSCLAASHGNGEHSTVRSNKDSTDKQSGAETLLASMEGSRVVAGTTAGDLRVWSVKDIYSAVLASQKEEDSDTKSMFGGGNVSNRLRFSLRGRALAGHRGGVTCIDVPSNVYRPDSLVTGGADGLIKLWSLRALATGRRSSSMTSQQDADGTEAQSRGGDALSVFSGHTSRVICVLSAWHGDRLLSGGADRTLRVWDLASGNGKCINKLVGHSGWVTMVKYWGPNTVVSASTDRSIALWDARLRDSPLFLLRSHSSPISDFLVGSRTDPMMISAGTDGTISTWDFRKLSGSRNMKFGTPDNDDSLSCHVVRVPARSLAHEINGTEKLATSSVRLARGFCSSRSSFLSVGSDAVIREWDISTGHQLDSLTTGHADAVTCVQSFGQSDGMTPSSRLQEGMITSSWDGTIRMKFKKT